MKIQEALESLLTAKPAWLSRPSHIPPSELAEQLREYERALGMLVLANRIGIKPAYGDKLFQYINVTYSGAEEQFVTLENSRVYFKKDSTGTVYIIIPRWLYPLKFYPSLDAAINTVKRNIQLIREQIKALEEA